ncbi:Tyrosine-protein phosphatase yvh1 [Taphrina deformans PYCC 5710]|uniref:protein-tyrosine-phosphatase n=1 Tax=Taphrina deformans (strain PYCC 5710 / ATCC 11124 / CBS 356.35 / IMI 108563 / JCM 9778 / NBRC 8474) TaxID=1097556 RepID=R4XA54_TAPDE|nr:Tyrosine-protein phosphatase yvh1 [Taphrina deformans PYCC 5710]|eukprot:CCG82627.1 Tyrosine-protein phosphatase yvh1 [Taphrina deformans PYCC 5710]
MNEEAQNHKLISSANLENDLRPGSLREKAAKLRSEAQDLFRHARESGECPDKAQIQAINSHAKRLEVEALRLEDKSPRLVGESYHEEYRNRPDQFQGQSMISRIEDGLYLSGYDVLQHETILRSCSISHILSICQFYLPSAEQQKTYTCKAIPALDTGDQNLLQYFSECVKFIDEARSANGRLLIHCHAGQSRSVTILAAYLMQRDRIGVRSALDKIRAIREVQPNDNFMNQLRLFKDCDYQLTEDNVQYRRWKFETMHKDKSAQSGTSTSEEQVPQHPDYQENDLDTKYTQIRCKKCRYVLASEKHIIAHEPKVTTEQPESQQSSLLPASCAHFFLEPIRWMKSELDKGQVDGRFTCPSARCGAKIGSYAWQGTTCSCRRWVLPALCIQRSKVDEMKSKTPAKVEPARKS